MSDYFPLDRLPDNFLVAVMARLPLEQLVRLDQVSTRWRWLQGMALRRITRLDLMIGDNPSRVVDLDKPRDFEGIQLDGTVQERNRQLGLCWIDPKATLPFANLDQDKLRWLTTSMPGIRTLTIIQGIVEVTVAVGQVTTMVNHWRGSLTSLTVQSLTNEEMSPESCVPLFDSINLLARLEDLSLKLYHLGTVVLDLSILARIRRFVFYSLGDPVVSLLDSLRRYASNNASLVQVHLANCVYSYIPGFLNLDQSVSSKITSMIFKDMVVCRDEFLPQICTKFRSLTHLQLNVRTVGEVELVAALATLPQLYYLKLDLCKASFWFLEYELNDPEYANLEQVAQLASIQVLHLTMVHSASHRDLAQMFNWGWTFPSLRVVDVEEVSNHGCEPCRIGPQSKRTSHCTRQLLSPFIDCPLLQKIAHWDGLNRTLWDGGNWSQHGVY